MKKWTRGQFGFECLIIPGNIKMASVGWGSNGGGYTARVAYPFPREKRGFGDAETAKAWVEHNVAKDANAILIAMAETQTTTEPARPDPDHTDSWSPGCVVTWEA